MKTERNNIEHLFKDKLQGHEMNPPEHLWANISQAIAPEKKQKKPFLFWYIGGGIAASLLIFTTLLFNFYPYTNNNTLIVTTKNDYCPEEYIVDNQEEPASTNKLNNQDNTTNALTLSKKNSVSSNITIKKPILNPSSKPIKSKETNPQKSNTSNSYAYAETPKNSFSENTKSVDNKDVTKPTIIEPSILEDENLTDTELIALLKPENEKEEIKKSNTKKWSLQPQLATYSYNSTSNDSSINSNFKNNPQDTETDLSYGIRIAYQATPKISIRTGISNANVNITTSNIGVDSSSNNELGELFSNNEVAIVNLDRTPTDNVVDFSNEEVSVPDSDGLVVDEVDAPENTTTAGSISQQIQYVEIPIEITYKLLNKKIEIDVIGGFSTFLLSKNESFFDSENNTTVLGETSSINNTSFSSNIGFSVDYNLIKNLKFSIEPMLKLQLNSFDNTTNYQPYFLGISSGLKWNF